MLTALPCWFRGFARLYVADVRENDEVYHRGCERKVGAGGGYVGTTALDQPWSNRGELTIYGVVFEEQHRRSGQYRQLTMEAAVFSEHHTAVTNSATALVNCTAIIDNDQASATVAAT